MSCHAIRCMAESGKEEHSCFLGKKCSKSGAELCDTEPKDSHWVLKMTLVCTTLISGERRDFCQVRSLFLTSAFP